MATNGNGTTHALGHFDPASIRLDQSYVEGTAVQKLLSVVHVGKPSNQTFFRTHPDDSYFVPVMGLVLDKDEGQFYAVQKDMLDELSGEFALFSIYTIMTRQKDVRLVPVKLPDDTGKHNSWHRSLGDGMEQAKVRWLRIKANRTNSCYDLLAAREGAVIPEPAWEDVPAMDQLLILAFRDRLISSYDHPMVRQLRGE
jgi:hypothetical protein